jgi:serine/threonine protein kinase/formylglycine-generating enzyme required for sulfatase activity
MTEEAIVRAALLRGTPQQRAAFLDEACGADRELRRRVEQLLETYPGPLVHPSVPRTSLAVTVDSGVPPGVQDAPPVRHEEPEVRASTQALQNSAEASVSATHATFGVPPFADSGPVPVDPQPAEAGPVRFRTLRRLAGGGLGEVFVAHDEELNREVALKEIRPSRAHDPDSRQRFVIEAEITGGLEHPGVVPVYSMGQHADGRPYYVMRLIKGDSLQQAIQRFHQASDGLESGERPMELRQLLGRFVAVCNTVAFAHNRGVLHRDLKPDNILLGPYGETLVVDWGLAKATGEPDKAMASEEEALLPLSGDSAPPTKMGQVLGTPGYMPPEQAEGRLHELGPASDVYSLGATLYCLLTGRPPFQEKDLLAVLQKVRQGDFPPPRRINRSIAPGLEAICLKALALRPADRYPSARALADDVEHWLADRPVTAYPDPLITRLSRWARRHRVLVTQAAALLVTVVVGLVISTALIIRSRQAAINALLNEHQAQLERDRAEVGALLHANPHAVPGLLASIKHFRTDVLPELREAWNEPEGPENRNRLIRVGLALLRVEPHTVMARLFDWMMQTEDPQEFLLLRHYLRPYHEEFHDALWELADDTEEAGRKRFRALVALVDFEGLSPRWETYRGLVADQLLSVDLQQLGTWSEALHQASTALIEPLIRAFRIGPVDRRRLAATLLANYAADQPDVLVDLLIDADERQYAILYPRLETRKGEAIAALRQVLARGMPPDDQVSARQVLARRQAQAAVALLQLGDAESVWPLLRHSPDPTRRTYLINLLAQRESNPELIIARLGVETDVSARRALLLSLGGFDDLVCPPERKRLEPQLLRWFREDPDPGIHSAVDWLVRRWWGEEKLAALGPSLAGPPQGTRRWYINGQGQTFALVTDPKAFRMGSPPYEPGRVAAKEFPHAMRIPRTVALATREVTVAQFRRFRKDHAIATEYSPGPEGPVINVSWYDAAAYCNWLSEQEGIPRNQWCYPEKIEPGMKLPADYLQRTGYRLPTEAEWEYACRAGATTSRCYGESDELLTEYAWYIKNTGDDGTQPVGQLKPNDWGLFDVHGNAAEWCQTRWLPDNQEADEVSGEDVEDPDLRVVDTQVRGYRGGGFFYRASNVRSAYRIANHPSYNNYHLGLRPARTVPVPPADPPKRPDAP